MHSLQNIWVLSHAKIIIGTPDRNSLILVRHVGLGKFLGQPIDVIEVAVGLILVLLVKFGIVESLVVEFGSRAVGWLADWFGLRVGGCDR
jgi:hypothetical protein